MSKPEAAGGVPLDRAPEHRAPGATAVTGVDRRGATRKVPMEVLCLGLSRTGTTSIRNALLELGYSDVYHYSSIFENIQDCELWLEALQAKYEGKGNPYGRKEWDALLGHCMAVSDTPCLYFHRELLEAYPEAKVVLTIRDSPEQWHRSIQNTIVPFMEWLNGKRPGVYEYFYYLFRTKDAFWWMNKVLFDHQWLADARYHGPIYYQGYNDEIQRLVPKERLLVCKVSEGWEPLCKFLGKPVPAHPIPKTNDAAMWNTRMAARVKKTDAAVHKKMWMAAGLASAVAAACLAAMYANVKRLW